MKVRVATCVPRQHWLQSEKIAWLDNAMTENPSDLFLTSQEFVGGGSMREICRLKGIPTDDVPVTEQWLHDNVASLAVKHKQCIGFGATVDRNGTKTEDFLYLGSNGSVLGFHSKMALPVEDSVVNGGASGVTPEVDPSRASKPVLIPELGLVLGTVFCWQVFFTDIWSDYSRQGCNLIVHPIKFAPRAWYKKGQNPASEHTRIGFTQDKTGADPDADTLGWIRKLKFESEFKEMPIAVTCNTWSGGARYLALVGWVDETTNKTELYNLPSVADTEKVVVTSYDPTLYDELAHLSLAVYGRFKDDWKALMHGTMRRKSVRIEQRARDGRAAIRLEKHAVTKAVEKAVLGGSQNGVAALSSFFDDF